MLKESIFIIIVLFSGVIQANEKEISPQLFEEIVKTIIPISRKYTNSINEFSVHNCRGDRKKWLGLVTVGNSFKQEFDFQKDCDLKGSYSPNLKEAFPVVFELRDIPLKSISMDVTLELKKELNFDIKLTAKNGVIISKDHKKLKFEGDYRIVVSPFSKDFIEKNYGGSFRYSNWNGPRISRNHNFKISKKSSKQ